VEFGLIEAGEMEAGSEGTEIMVERRSVAVFARKAGVWCRLGASFGGRWDDPLPVRGDDVDVDVELDEGMGLLFGAGLRYVVWARDGLRLEAFGEVTHRREEYATSYEGTRRVEILTLGTNDVPEAGTAWETVTGTDDAELVETTGTLGLALGFRAGGWECFGGLGYAVLSDAELISGLRVGDRTYDVDIERAQRVQATAGFAFLGRGPSLFLRLGVGHELTLGAGVSLGF
jgi:hypothetical protein